MPTTAIPLIDLSIPHQRLLPGILEELKALVQDSDFIGGKRLKRFEEAFASFTGARYAVGVSNGTSALTLALRAAGIQPGDEVITVANTFIATVEAIIEAGAIPVFVDVDPDTALMDMSCVQRAITGKTRAIIPVHLYGSPVALDRLTALCQQADLRLIQDAAQAHGALWDGKPLSAFGDAQTYSFYPGKNLGAWGDAGAVTTSSDSLRLAVQSLRDHGRHSNEKYVHHDLGGNHRMDPLQGIVLLAKLPSLGDENAIRRRLHDQMITGLHGVGDLRFFRTEAKATSVHHLFVLRTASRDALKKHLAECGVSTGVHYPVPLHRQPALSAFAKVELPHTERLAGEILSLPFFPGLQPEQVERIVGSVREFFQRGR